MDDPKDEVCQPGLDFLPPQPGRWFRAPHADASPAMKQVLRRYGFTNVLCDCFGNDTVLKDAGVIAEGLLAMVDDLGGSIIVVHIPERGFRENNLQALRLLLEGLSERGLQATSLSQLNDAAWEGGEVLPAEVDGAASDASDHAQFSADATSSKSPANMQRDGKLAHGRSPESEDRLGDFTVGVISTVAAKGRQARGSSQDGEYKFGDITRGLVALGSSAASSLAAQARGSEAAAAKTGESEAPAAQPPGTTDDSKR